MLLSVFLPGWTWLFSYLHAFHFKPSIIILSVVWYNKNAYLSTQGQKEIIRLAVFYRNVISLAVFKFFGSLWSGIPFFEGKEENFHPRCGLRLQTLWCGLNHELVLRSRSCFSFYRKTSKLENVERHLERGSFWHLPRLPDKDNIKRKNKNNEAILSRFFPEQKTERSFVLRHICPIHEVLTLFFSIPKPTLIPWA